MQVIAYRQIKTMPLEYMVRHQIQDVDDRYRMLTTPGKYRSLSRRPSTVQTQYVGQSSGAQPKDRAHASNTSDIGVMIKGVIESKRG